MASRYWVGGTASWDGTAGTKWATTSGGAGGAAVPTSADDVFLDSNSGSGTVTLSTGWTCRSFDSTGFTGTVAGSTNGSVGDGTAGASNNAWVWGAGITRTFTGQITLASTSSTTQNITSNGKTFGNRITIDGAGSSYSLSDTISMAAATLFVTRGSFTSNGQTMTIGAFNSAGTATRSITLSNSTVTCISSGTGGWNVSSTGLTFTTNSSTSVTCGGATGISFIGGGLTYNGTWTVQNPTTSGTGAIQGTNTFENLTITGNADKNAEMTVSANQTISGNLTINGNSVTNRLLFRSNTVGTARTLTCNGTVSASNLDLSDITGAGSASWDISACTGKSGDAGGNSGITFTTGATQTWSGTSGGNWSANAWTTRVPLPQDDVVINAAFAASQTISCDMPRLGKSIDFTGVTGSPALGTSTADSNVFGSLTLASGLGNCTGFIFHPSGRSASTITSAGKTISDIQMENYGATITMADALTVQNSCISTYGTLATGGYSLTVSYYAAGAGGLNATNSTVTITGTSGFTGGAGTHTMTGSTVYFSSGTTSLLNPSGVTMGAIQLSNGLTLSVTSALNATSVTRNGSTACGVTVTAGLTVTLTGGASAMGAGTSGNLITWQSSSGGSAFTISSTTTLVTDYISLKDCTGSGGIPHYAGANSTNVSGNTNWLFAAPGGSLCRRTGLCRNFIGARDNGVTVI